MKLIVLILFLVLPLAGCADMNVQRPVYGGKQATVLFYPTDVDTLLACVHDSSALERDELEEALAQAEKQLGSDADSDALRYICLTLHEKATYRQFKAGLDFLDSYVQNHPDRQDGLLGVQVLAQRINQEKIDRWSVRNRLLDEKEALERESAEYRERLARYEEGDQSLVGELKRLREKCDQDQARISDLQNQIEQLKNIENIIKNREQ